MHMLFSFRRRMSVLITAALFCGVAFTALHAQTSDEPVTQVESLQKHIYYLASDALVGRRTGERGNYQAAAYLAEMFQRYGLKPVSGGQGYFHRFPYLSGVEFGPLNRLQIFTPDGTVELDSMQFAPMKFSESATAVGPLAFVGYGISASDLNYDDYQGIDVKGKIVVMMRYSPDGASPHSEFGRHASFISKIVNAKEKGAAGIIMIERPEVKPSLIETGFDRNFTGSTIPVMTTLSTVFDAVRDPEGRTLAKLQKDIDEARAPASFVMKGYSAKLSADVRYLRDSVPNVLAQLPGNDPVLAHQAIVIGGHFDHLGMGGEGSLHSGDPAIHYGADDNASGTAGVLELARYFSRTGGNRRTLIFMGFNGEEEGLLGSSYLAKNQPFPYNNVIAMINMDMVGRLDTARALTVQGMGTSPEWEPLVTRLNRDRFMLKLVKDGFGPSDHSSFYLQDVPVLFFFTGIHEDYHRPSDTPDKINYEGEVDILNFVADIVRVVDGMKKRPQFTEVEQSTTPGRAARFNVYVGTIPDYAYEGKGLRLDGTAKGGPAEKSGLKGGDVIMKMDNFEIGNIYEYMEALSKFEPKQEVEVEFIRDGQTMKTMVEMGNR